MLPTMTSTRILIGMLLLLSAPGGAGAVEKTNDAVWHERIETDCKLQAKNITRDALQEAPHVRQALH